MERGGRGDYCDEQGIVANVLWRLIDRTREAWEGIASAWGARRRRLEEANDMRSWVEDDRCVVLQGPERCEIPIAEIAEVVAFKRDHVTIDCVCVEIFARGLYYETNEDCGGFWKTVDDLMNLLGGDVNWRDKVILPGFKECRTVIYRRGAPP